MLYSVTDLDVLICVHCRRSLREHCTAAEGAWYYSPCRTHLLTLAPADWREQVTEHGLCLSCCRSVELHFPLWTPQASVATGDVTTDIQPSGNVIARVPVGFIDCR